MARLIYLSHLLLNSFHALVKFFLLCVSSELIMTQCSEEHIWLYHTYPRSCKRTLVTPPRISWVNDALLEEHAVYPCTIVNA